MKRFDLRVPAAVAAVAFVLTGCSGEPDTRPTVDGTVLQPDRPGDPVEELDEAPVIEQAEANDADVRFVQMMIPHHAQALEMSRLAKKRAEDPRVRTLAERIHAVQGPEIRLMSSWLAERDLEVPRVVDEAEDFDHAKHGHAGMAGMLSAEEMARLAASRGGTFDRLFLRGMIGHHRGALTMVDEITPEGADIRVAELATDVYASQVAEIARMQDVLRSL
jgi:uncharacterized protein (DUF305 family)